MNEKGNASITILAFLFMLSAIFLGTAFFMRSILGYFYEVDTATEVKTQLTDEVTRFINLMCDDQTPEADSPLDPIWAEIKLAIGSDTTIELEDLSSRINLNWENDYLINVADIFQENVDYDQFNTIRTDLGLSFNLTADYEDFFTKEALRDLCTDYSWFNINTANENMLYTLFELRTDKKATSTQFPNRLRAKRSDKTLITTAMLPDLMGLDWEALFPYINAEPTMNINLVPEPLLKAVFAMAKNTYKLELPEELIDAIINLREQTEITPDQLAAVIKPQFKNTILESYLGCTTWFWRFTLTQRGRRYQCIVARLPVKPKEKESGPVYRIIEESFGSWQPDDTQTGDVAVDE